MSALIVVAGERTEMPGFPPHIAAEIMRFLASGKTGNFQVTVKEGQITGCHVTTFLAVKPPRRLDDNGHVTEDSE